MPNSQSYMSNKICPPSQHGSMSSVYFDKIGRVEKTPAYVLTSVCVGTEVSGPAVVIDDTQMILVTPWGLCIALELGGGG